MEEQFDLATVQSAGAKETIRSNALRSAGILDSRPSLDFDSIVHLACSIFDAPIALVSLVDADRQWFKAKKGINFGEAPRALSFCGNVVETMEPLIVQNAAADGRFSANTFVSGPTAVKFYAGAPLLEGGICYGSLCVMDVRCRTFTEENMEQLESLATVAVGLIRGHSKKMRMREQQRELELRQARFEQTERSAKVGGFEMNLRTGAITWSDQVFRIVGLPIGTPLNAKRVIACYAPEERASVKERILNARGGAASALDRQYRIITPSGDERWVHIVSDMEIIEDEPRRLFGIIQDVTERVLHERKLVEAACTDSLTGLENRAAYLSHVSEIMIGKDPHFGLLLIDVDHLKQVNDTLGHAAGDMLLTRLASKLKSQLGERGRIFRLGGDEFAAVLSRQVTPKAMAAVARQLIQQIADPLTVASSTLLPKITIGGAMLEPGMDAAALSQNADFALYHAKEICRGGYLEFEPRMRTSIARRIHQTREVEKALVAGRFVPYYQPTVRSSDGDICGFEALARMKTDDGSVISAGEFSEALTDPSISYNLTTIMLGHVASDMRKWIDRGVDFGRISINVGAADFQRGDLESRIHAALIKKGIKLDKIVIEVTETVFMQGLEEAVAATLQRLRGKGVLVALDDFGTGYASLTHLRSLPVDIIKIDKSFVDTMSRDISSRAIIELVNKLALQLKMKVTAEGVETFGQASSLLEMGCSSLQGFLFAKPMEAELVEPFISHRRSTLYKKFIGRDCSASTPFRQIEGLPEV